MSFDQITAFNAVVRNISASLGWSQQVSSCTLQLVDDPVNGWNFAPPVIGSPASVSLGAFSFGGVVQRSVVNRGFSGNPTYTVQINDARVLLENCQCILAGYNGTVAPLSNIISVFGFLENLYGFGGSGSNATGLSWVLARDAIQTIINSAATQFGGPLSLQGYFYSIDLSDIPSPPPDYRISGNSMSLLDLIGLVVSEAGHDFFVDLVGYTVTIRTVSRIPQAPLGTISTVIAAQAGNVVQSENGMELRNEVTSVMLTGGQETILNVVDSTGIKPFWGFDVLGNVILSSTGNIDGLGDNVTVNLNASPISDIVGADTYLCNIIELRMAMTSYENWAAYIQNYRPTVDAVLRVLNPLVPAQGNQRLLNPPPIRKGDMMRGNAELVKNMGLIASGATSDILTRSHRVHEFVKNYATQYMGKKFYVDIPNVYRKINPDTLEPVYSHEPTDGGYLPEGSTPLGLVGYNNDVFKLADRRYIAFVKYTNMTGADISTLPPKDSVVQGSDVYLKCAVDPTIYFSPNASVVISLPNAIFEGFSTIYGVSPSSMQALFNGIAAMFSGPAHGTYPARIQPAPRSPDYAAVPLKSNVSTYGPWFASGAPGRTIYAQDTTLTPWNYGSVALMNLAGIAKVFTSFTNGLVHEAGSIELAGVPLVPLGRVLQAGGPNVTNISIQYGVGGITTSYRFETFTQKFGVFSKDNSERIRRLVNTSRIIDNKIKDFDRQARALANTEARAYNGFLANASKAIKRESPYEMLMMESIDDNNAGKRVGGSAVTIEEFYTNLRAHGGHTPTGCATIAGASWTAMFRPFAYNASTTTFPLDSGTQTPYMSLYKDLGSNSVFTNGPITAISSQNYHPFAGDNDIECYPWGSGFDNSLHNYRLGAGHYARPVSLRGPLVMTGWGFGTDGKCYPSATGVGEPNNTFVDRYKYKSHLWKTGPVDLLWDEHRGVWTAHDIVYGVSSGTIPSLGKGIMRVVMPQMSGGNMIERETGYGLSVMNPYSINITTGQRMQASYIANTHGYVASSIDWAAINTCWPHCAQAQEADASLQSTTKLSATPFSDWNVSANLQAISKFRGSTNSVVTSCCSNTMPTGLFANFGLTSTCSNLNGLTIPLQYIVSGPTPMWSGNALCGANTRIMMRMQCVNGDTFDWTMRTDWLSLTNTTISNRDDNFNATCSPFYAEFTPFYNGVSGIIDCCIQGYASGVNLTITE